MDDREARDRVARVEALLDELDSFADPAARDKAVEVVQALLDLYGEGLARIVDRAVQHDGGKLGASLVQDELVAHLLLVHGLHPVPLEDRVREALEEVRPYLESHGGNVELIGVEQGVVRLALEGSCSGCPSSAMTLELAIEEAIRKTAPDVEDIEAEGAVAPEPAPGLLQLEVLPTGAGAPAGGGNGGGRAWEAAGAMPGLAGGASRVKEVSGERVLFLELGDDLYAYRPRCPGCGGSLEDGALSGAELSCPGCGNLYDVRHAGRSVDGSGLHLVPVPLLIDDGGQVKVALGSAAG